MREQISRRVWLQTALAASAFVAGKTSAQQGMLDAAAPDAKALGFVIDASTVDIKANPTFSSGQRCGSCSQFGGKAGDAAAGCAIFGGRQVPAAGWCSVWTQNAALKI